MKMKLLVTFAAFALFGTTAVAEEQVFENELGEHVVAEEPTDADVEFSLQDLNEEPDQWGRVWHCTAYVDGHGHGHGYDYIDVHYDHAYWGAMERCERATHYHCHDIHCHQDYRH